MTNKESLPYEQFARLSDEDILKSHPLKLLEQVRNKGNENNYKLYTIVANYLIFKWFINNKRFRF